MSTYDFLNGHNSVDMREMSADAHVVGVAAINERLDSILYRLARLNEETKNRYSQIYGPMGEKSGEQAAPYNCSMSLLTAIEEQLSALENVTSQI